MSSGYGWRTHPTRGGRRFHAGIDLALPSGTPTRTVAGGTVVKVGNTDPQGYGNQVIVRTPDGHHEQFSHLASMSVRVGEVIQPGTTVGTVGSTGSSTGPHLDFAVYKPGAPLLQDYQNGTYDPVIYLRDRVSAVATPPGTGPAPSVPVDNALPEGDTPLERANNLFSEMFRYQPRTPATGGRVNTGNSSSRPEAVFNNATPQQTSRAALHRNSYPPNNPTHNYGYRQIADDPDYAAALSEVADDLGIPAQWLADVIDFESDATHSTSITNSIGCIGLIQLCPNNGLLDVARMLGVSQSVARQRVSNMTRAEYLRTVNRAYLSRYSEGGKLLNTIEDLYTLVNAGPTKLRWSPAQRVGINDVNYVNGRRIGGQLLHHFRQLGNRAGRRYESSYDNLQSNLGHVHENIVPGCAECQRMQQNFGGIYPHYDAIG